ncbi:MAG: hypothetical protein NC409_10725 [Clostridium sp.]|nr:hypothetical protein [Clostridium sp.]
MCARCDAGYQGDITVEGWHDPVYCNERELEERKRALEYLREIAAQM